MKQEAVCALRERGLCSDVCRCAELRDFERQFKQQQKNEDTIKAYLLRDLKAVQPQNSTRSLRTEIARPATKRGDRR